MTLDEEFKKSYMVFDVETTVRCPVGSNKANPHWPSNHMVMYARKSGLEDRAHHGYGGKQAKPNEFLWDIFNNFVTEAKILVGHNLPFDLQWLKRISDNKVDLSEKTIWDTALAEYVLTGQEHKFPSLDDLCKKYGCPLKDSKVSDMWKAGVDTTDIPQSLLVAYCVQDVESTEKIFLMQLQEAKKKGCLKLILVLNDALLAITEMMWNGMKVDAKSLHKFTIEYEAKVMDLERELITEVVNEYSFPMLNIDSPKHLSALLYGGEIEYDTKEEIGKYKTGTKAGLPKYKTVKQAKKFPGIVNKKVIVDLRIVETEHGFSTAVEYLNKLALEYPTNKYISIIKEYREYEKQLNTYFINTKELLFPLDFIYHNINPTTTHTGRYSSSEPNLQNVTSGEKSDIKRCYISRYEEEGVLVELDFEQLEMCGLAQLSHDEVLIEDISSKVDIHTALYKSIFGKSPSKEERTQFKRASFALIYGAGVKKIAKTVGISESVARTFIYRWVERYYGISYWWKAMEVEVRAARELSDRKDVRTGKPLGKAKMSMPSGRILTFYETLPEWLSTPIFSPNELKNYPIQSFATGDVVPLFLGKLYRRLELSRRNGCLMNTKLVNTVHDSVVLDCHRDDLEQLLQVLKNESANLSKHIKAEFGIEMLVPLRTQITYGPNWNEQTKVPIGTSGAA